MKKFLKTCLVIMVIIVGAPIYALYLLVKKA